MSDDENVLFFPGQTKEGFSPEMVLRGALKADLSEVIVIGWDQDEQLFFAGSNQDGPEILWLLEKARMALFVKDSDE